MFFFVIKISNKLLIKITYILSPFPDTTYFPSGETPSILQGTLNYLKKKDCEILIRYFELTESINSPLFAHHVFI